MQEIITVDQLPECLRNKYVTWGEIQDIVRVKRLTHKEKPRYKVYSKRGAGEIWWFSEDSQDWCYRIFRWTSPAKE